MKEITTTYKIVIDGAESTYTETREAQDIRDAHYQIMSHWYGVDSITFVGDVEA